MESDFFTDDVDRARSTSVYTTDGINYYNISSEAPIENAIEKRGTGKVTYYFIVPTGITFDLTDTYNTIPESSYPEGNKLRSAICRIRAVYRSGTK